MGTIFVRATPIEQWLKLVQEAEANLGTALHEELESYLVYLLQRYLDKPEVVKSVLALEFLISQDAIGATRRQSLREVGDKCLLFSGFFPQNADRKRVPISYFVHLGQNAYDTLSILLKTKTPSAELYAELGEHFVTLMDTLQYIRELAGAEHKLSILQAEELWRETHSAHALARLQEVTQAAPICTYHPNSKLSH